MPKKEPEVEGQTDDLNLDLGLSPEPEQSDPDLMPAQEQADLQRLHTTPPPPE